MRGPPLFASVKQQAMVSTSPIVIMRSFNIFSPAFIFAILSSVAPAADWPQYLGPSGDAISSETIHGDWETRAPKVLWKAKVGKGCGSWSIFAGKALVVGNDGANDIVSCRNAETGKLIWQHQYPEKLVPNLYEGGPNTTPTVDGNRVYTLSKSGVLFCLSLEDGRPVWRGHLKDDLGGDPGSWGFTASPVVDGNLVYVLPCSKDGAFYALDKMTGKVAWHTSNIQRSGYATPVLTEIKGKKAALVFYGRTVVAHDLTAKGRILFEHRWKTSYNVNASNPQYYEGKVFFASGYGMGYAVLDVTGKTPKILHRDQDIRMIFQNSIRSGNTITGVFGDKRIDAELMRMDLATGKIHWREKMPGTRASSALVGSTQVLLAETGELIAGKVSNSGFKETGRLKILSGKCWSPFAVSDGRLIARSNNGDAVCLDVRP